MASLTIGVDIQGKIVMYAIGDDYTEPYYPKYCPSVGENSNMDNMDKMTEQDQIRLLKSALYIAAMYAHDNPPANIPDDMSLEEFTSLYVGTSDDIFGERFIARWLNTAKKLSGFEE